MNLPTVNTSAHMGIDLFNAVRNSSDNYDEVRDCTLTHDKPSSRETSISSTVLSVAYHNRMTINNDNDGDTIIEPINMPQLSYVILWRQNNQVSMAANPNNNTINQHALIKDPALNNSISSIPSCVDVDNNINIQLLYNPNRPTEPELWDSNFHPVSLHRLLEHLASDTKNIRKLMVYMATYIKNKKIETSKFNNIKNFEGIGKAAWDLISYIYDTGWDSLIVDNYRNSFRQKFSYKFTPCISLEKHGKKQETSANKSASIKRLSPPISVKSPKEVKEISKYFKSKPPLTTLNHTKSYAQSARNISNTEKVLKIKVAFSSLKATNINNIQKIIKGYKNPKTKL